MDTYSDPEQVISFIAGHSEVLRRLQGYRMRFERCYLMRQSNLFSDIAKQEPSSITSL